MMPQSPESRHFGTSHSSPSHHQQPCRSCLNLTDGWNLFPFKDDFSFGKSQKSQGTQSGHRGAESPGRLDVSPKNFVRDSMHERTHCCVEAAGHQLPIAVAFRIIWIVFAEECSSLTQNLMQIPCSSCSVILNATATEYTCSLGSLYHPHWLVQWSRHCSLMCIPVPSPWLVDYIDVMQTFLIILIMVGLSLNRLNICSIFII